MVTYLLKKSYQLKDLKQIEFQDLWGDHGIFTTMWIFGKPAKILFFDNHLKNLILSLKKYQIKKKSLKSDILEIFEAVVKDKLKKVKIKNSKNYSICIVIASKGYPGSFEIDKEISNLNKVQKNKGIKIFHAGTKFLNEKIVSSGGRVLSITSESENLENAKKIAYNTINKLNWKHGFYRKDIGWRTINKK